MCENTAIIRKEGKYFVLNIQIIADANNFQCKRFHETRFHVEFHCIIQKFFLCMMLTEIVYLVVLDANDVWQMF